MNIRPATPADAPTIATQRDAMFVDMGEDAGGLARVHPEMKLKVGGG